MKKLIPIFCLFIIPTIAGCGLKWSLSDPGDVRTTAVLAGIAAYEIGYTVGQIEDPEVDRAIRNVYKLAKTGELTKDGINQVTDLLTKKIPDRPTLPRNIMKLLELVGLNFDIDGNPIGLDQIPAEVFQAVETEYIAGIELYNRQKAGELSAADIEFILSLGRYQYAAIECGREGG